MPAATAPRLVRNPAPGEVAPGGDVALVHAFHRRLAGYAPTPLVEARHVAAALGVRRALVKDESSRLGLPSFKILGASWATYRRLCAWLGRDPEPLLELRDLAALLREHGPLALVAATDGNHGRAVARMARLLGLGARIFVPADMVAARRAGLRAEFAEVTVVDGDYDDAVAAAARVADDHHLVVADTSWPGYTEVPSWVVDGYATIGAEADAEGARPDVVGVQIGVGALAVALVRHFRPRGARVVGVEPTAADCVAASLEAGRIVRVPAPHDSIMAGLNCGTPSLVAWPDLERGLDAVAVVDDEATREAMRLLARDGVTSGESGAAGVAGLLEFRDALGLDGATTVLAISTEGATDPGAYRAIVGGEPAGRRLL